MAERRQTEDFAPPPDGVAPQPTDSAGRNIAVPTDEGEDEGGGYPDDDEPNPPRRRRGLTGRQMAAFGVLGIFFALFAAVVIYNFSTSFTDDAAPAASSAGNQPATATKVTGAVAPAPASAAQAEKQPAATPAPAAAATAGASASLALGTTVVVNEMHWLIQCVGFGGTADGCRARLDKLAPLPAPAK